MNVLGICDSQDSGACLFVNEKLKYAVSEERLNRVKQTRLFPKLSIMRILKENNLNIKDIDKLVLASTMTPFFPLRLFNKSYEQSFRKNPAKQFNYSLNLYTFYQVIAQKIGIVKNIDAALSKIVIKNKLDYKEKIEIIDHHRAHAASAYYTSGLREALIITIDGMGDGISVTVSVGKDNEINRIYSQNSMCSITNYYSSTTEFLGFTPIKHEGKITGLAAYGNPEKTQKIMEKGMYFKGRGFNYLNYLIPNSKKRGIFKKLKKYSREDIAAGLQKNLEVQVCKFISHWITETGIKDVVFAGGLFANVKLNQKIHELDNVDKIFIFPHMGDGGLAVGAVLDYIKPRVKKLNNVYLGPKYGDNEIKKQLDKSGLKYKKLEKGPKKIAKLIDRGKVVALVQGRMEFGPRALGNRSLIFRPDRKKLNDLVNQKLNRTSFMPFSPTILKKDVKKFLKDIEGAEYTAKFMNITFKCTDWMKKNCPGVVHIDGTARPQILERKDNAFFYDIINEFKKLSGFSCVLNTSFNMHGEPIVNSPSDAINTFKKSKVDYLVLEKYLIENKI